MGPGLRGAESGLEDPQEGGDKVPAGVELPAPFGWVSVGLVGRGDPYG